ncbi:MAG: DUF6514 family protein [Oscillospiraceae bacterium]
MSAGWNYRVMEETIDHPEFGRYITYGIQVGCETEHGWEPMDTLHDVTTDSCIAKLMALLFNSCQLSPVHLREVVGDLLP